jgi:cell division septation protein DedD
MAETQDTEITLGTGKMLVLFFGLVALCSAFFAVGFKLGRGSGMDTPLSSTVATNGTARPSTANPATNPSDLTFYKTVGQDAAATPLTTPDPVPSPTSGYFVQVAAVSKQEDADSLVDALKKKQYSAFTNMLADKLYHVQVGPFGDIKDAEVTRAKLVGDGYNPILKK